MRSITVTEFRQNFTKYNELAKNEIIVVTFKDRQIYTLVPKRLKDLETLRSFKGILPKDAKFGEDPLERE